jgi:hypothetical protein
LGWFRDESILPDGAGLSNISALLSLAAARILSPLPLPTLRTVRLGSPTSPLVAENNVEWSRFLLQSKNADPLKLYFLLSKKETKARKGFGFFGRVRKLTHAPSQVRHDCC